MSVPIVSLGIDLAATFDGTTAIRLVDACKLIRGRNGQGRLHLDVARRWATRGCRPAGEKGPRLILPSVRLGGCRLTMVAWVEAFEKMRVRLSAGVSGERVPTRTKREAQRAYEEACRALD